MWFHYVHRYRKFPTSIAGNELDHASKVDWKFERIQRGSRQTIDGNSEIREAEVKTIFNSTSNPVGVLCFGISVCCYANSFVRDVESNSHYLHTAKREKRIRTWLVRRTGGSLTDGISFSETAYFWNWTPLYERKRFLCGLCEFRFQSY